MADNSQSKLSLSRFRYHTGAQPTPLAPDEKCPPLFRDIGDEAMARFLVGDLKLLCGPVSPITYLRTADYREPYTDYGQIGRVMLLNPELVSPWRSGLESVFITSRATEVNPDTMVFLPAEIPMVDAAVRLDGVKTFSEFQDAIGTAFYSEAVAETRHRVNQIIASHAETEKLAAPLRKLFQSSNREDREKARTWMEQLDIDESDLCMAWHHLPEHRRAFIKNQLRELPQLKLAGDKVA